MVTASVRILDEEPALTDSDDSPHRPGRASLDVGPKDGDAMINDAGKHRVKGEENLAAEPQNVAEAATKQVP